MKWALRILALAITTVCGISFLGHICFLLLDYNYEHRRFPPFVKEAIPDTIWLGLGFLCSAICYFYLVRNMRAISK
jgi:cell division protein FtsW (lipid II flippase)